MRNQYDIDEHCINEPYYNKTNWISDHLINYVNVACSKKWNFVSDVIFQRFHLQKNHLQAYLNLKNQLIMYLLLRNRHLFRLQKNVVSFFMIAHSFEKHIANTIIVLQNRIIEAYAVCVLITFICSEKGRPLNLLKFFI